MLQRITGFFVNLVFKYGTVQGFVGSGSKQEEAFHGALGQAVHGAKELGLDIGDTAFLDWLKDVLGLAQILRAPLYILVKDKYVNLNAIKAVLKIPLYSICRHCVEDF